MSETDASRVGPRPEGRGGEAPFPTRSDEGDRGRHMGARVRRTAERVGVSPGAARWLVRVHEVAMMPRRAHLSGDRHTDFLHPGRSALILLLDVQSTDAVVLAATLLAETRTPELRLSTERAGEALRRGRPVGSVRGEGRLPPEEGGSPDDRTDRTLAIRDAVPDPASESLAEELVVAPEEVRLAALAERLDHLRHAHLWTDADARRRAYDSAKGVYGPVAARTHEALARRYRWWTRMFARRYL